MSEPKERSESEIMKTQGLFLVARLLLFLAIILIALMVIFALIRNRAYWGPEKQNLPAVERPVPDNLSRQKGDFPSQF